MKEDIEKIEESDKSKKEKEKLKKNYIIYWTKKLNIIYNIEI